MSIVEPSVWKKFHGLRGKNKEQSRLRALQLFPPHALLARKKDHVRAEAALIGAFGLRSSRFVVGAATNKYAPAAAPVMSRKPSC
jgi:hypothetical protein